MTPTGKPSARKLLNGTEDEIGYMLATPVFVNTIALTLSLMACAYMLTHGLDTQSVVATWAVVLSGGYFVFGTFIKKSVAGNTRINVVLSNLLPIVVGLSPYWLDGLGIKLREACFIAAYVWSLCIAVGLMVVLLAGIGVLCGVIGNLRQARRSRRT